MEIIKRNIFSDLVLINYLLTVVLSPHTNLESYTKTEHILTPRFCCHYVAFDV